LIKFYSKLNKKEGNKMTFWEYPEYLEKSSTQKISVYKNKVNGALILHDANDFGNKMVYMGYGIQEAKRLFKLHLKGIQ
tara:strand:+ start:75 stop:311 length:237 start_codon:yes stop_codon:yes gene_type:complete